MSQTLLEMAKDLVLAQIQVHRLSPEVGRPKMTKQAQFSCPECGPRHHIPVPVSVPIRFRGA